MIFVCLFNLKTRRFVKEDRLVLASVLSWFIYVSIQVTDTWTKKTTGAIPQFYYAIVLSTIFYTCTLCSILYSSFRRFIALTEVKSTKETFEKTAFAIVGIIFTARMIRTGFIFANNGNTQFPVSTILQLATLFPFLVIRIGADTYSLVKLVRGRIMFTMNSNAHVVEKALILIGVEIALGVLAFVVAVEEALSYQGEKPAYLDWLLISWCMVGWVDQQGILRKIFAEESHSSEIIEKKPSVITAYFYDKRESAVV
ncbi:hypothetical protein BDR26DRAFT_871610 [Obelidium mucronatum]|nr:hypothetical protein BDR26DRAFT_871610 [Obelidium mucronatum]